MDSHSHRGIAELDAHFIAINKRLRETILQQFDNSNKTPSVQDYKMKANNVKDSPLGRFGGARGQTFVSCNNPQDNDDADIPDDLLALTFASFINQEAQDDGRNDDSIPDDLPSLIDGEGNVVVIVSKTKDE
jgi:hypothetical protein